jgi:hypothetical protein
VPRPRGPAQNRPHAGDELVVDERPHDVVVTPPCEPAHAVDRVAARANHDHRHIAVPRPPGLALAEAAADLETGSVREHGVEEHEARARLLDEFEGRRGPVGGQDFEAVVCELLLEIGPHRSLVLDHQNRAPDHGG